MKKFHPKSIQFGVRTIRSPAYPSAMATAYHGTMQRPREWRRRISVRARIRSGKEWSDGQVLNVSSHGMLLQYSRPLAIGNQIDVCQEGRFVPCTVVWREGFKAGLVSNASITVADWVAASIDQASGVGVVDDRRLVRRQRPKRREDDWQFLAKRLHHVAIAALAAGLAMAVAAMAAQALITPLLTAAHALS